jgi:hypothetical protein
MGKKRSYQWQAVPDEAGATDYKTYPNDSQDADRDDVKLSRKMEGKFRRTQLIRKSPHSRAQVVSRRGRDCKPRKRAQMSARVQHRASERPKTMRIVDPIRDAARWSVRPSR